MKDSDDFETVTRGKSSFPKGGILAVVFISLLAFGFLIYWIIYHLVWLGI